jgi:hypothetical protein
MQSESVAADAAAQPVLPTAATAPAHVRDSDDGDDEDDDEDDFDVEPIDEDEVDLLTLARARALEARARASAPLMATTPAALVAPAGVVRAGSQPAAATALGAPASAAEVAEQLRLLSTLDAAEARERVFVVLTFKIIDEATGRAFTLTPFDARAAADRAHSALELHSRQQARRRRGDSALTPEDAALWRETHRPRLIARGGLQPSPLGAGAGDDLDADTVFGPDDTEAAAASQAEAAAEADRVRRRRALEATLMRESSIRTAGVVAVPRMMRGMLHQQPLRMQVLTLASQLAHTNLVQYDL